MSLNNYLDFEIYDPEEDEIPFYIDFRAFIERLSDSELLTESQRVRMVHFKREFYSSMFSLDVEKVSPPLLPSNIPVVYKNYYFEDKVYDESVQGQASLQIRERAYNFFISGMREYCKYLQYINFPVQLRVDSFGRLLIRVIKDSSRVHYENLHLFFWTYFVAIEVGRKFAIASHFNSATTLTLSEYNPNRTLQFFINNPKMLPPFLQDPHSPVYFYVSFRHTHNFVSVTADNLQKLIDHGFMKVYDHETVLKQMYGQRMLLVTTNNPPLPITFEPYSNNMNDGRTRYNEIVVETNPDTLNPVDYADLMNGEVRGISRLYMEYMCKNLGTVIGMASENRLMDVNILSRARDAIEESDFLYNSTIENYHFEDFFLTGLPLVGGTDLINHNSDTMFEINTDINESFNQSDVLFRIFHKAYIGARDSYLINDNIKNFLNNFMSNITHFRVVLNLRPENKLGQEVINTPGGVDFVFDQNDVYFNWVDNISYTGVYPVNLYNFIMERVMNFWEAFANYYEAYLNSFIYKVKSMRVEYVNYPQAGGCRKTKIYHQDVAYRGIPSSDKARNCFFEALNPHLAVTFGGANDELLDLNNKSLSFPLTLSGCKCLRRRMGLKGAELVPVNRLDRLGLNINFKVKTISGDTIFESKGAYGSCYEIYFYDGHFFTRESEKTSTAVKHAQVCPSCLKPASLEHVEKCRGKRGLYKKGDYHKFVRFSRKKQKEYTEEGRVSFITADIETFPVHGEHVPYSIAFNSKYTDDLLNISEKAEKIIREKVDENGNVSYVDDQVYMFKGETCIDDFINQLARFKGLRYVVFHNGSRYDLILILQRLIYFKQEDVTVKNIIHKGSKILSLEILFARNKNSIIFWDSCLHLLGSLKSLCHVFKVPDELKKGDFDHTLITSWEDVYYLENMWKPYLLNDILSLKYVVERYEDEIISSMGFSPLKFVTISSLSNHVIKKDIDKNKYQVYIPEDFDIDTYFRNAIYGGRTSPVIQNFDSTHEDDYLVALDVKSLYPYAMHEAEFFLGAPTFKKGRELHHMFFRKNVEPGIYLVNVIPPTDEHRYPVPFLPMRGEKNTLLWCYKHTQQTYTSHMINFAFTIGYDFVPESGYVFERTTNNIFKDSNNFWQEMKNTAERDGNEGKRQIAKIANNSGYGKQIEQNVVQKTLYCTKKEAYEHINTHGYKNVHVFTSKETENCFVIIKERSKHPKTPTHLGAVILDYSKIVMYQYFLKFMKPYSYGWLDDVYKFAPYYTDTDSIFLHVSHLESLQYAIGDDFGKLDYDLKDKEYRIYYARFHAPKTYFFTAVHHVTKKELKKQRTKGFPDKNIPFESLVLISGVDRTYTVTFDTIQRTVFNKNNGASILNLKNIVISRTLNLNCFNRCLKVKSKVTKGQYFFVPFFE
jgi:hypothetical protein